MGTGFVKLREIFLEAVEQHSPETWPEFIDRACRGDAALKADLERLLAAHARGEREAPSPPPDWLGREIGPYRLVEKIGEGGMGTVYMAEQSEPIQRRVALKIIRPGLDSRSVIARFEAERQVLALMDHPNIARVLDAGTTRSGEPFFVMELIKGVAITRFCDERQLTPRERLELCIPVCRAVQHAHQKGIVHRDLKPSNVLIALYDGRAVPKVIDFGVAKAISQPLTDLKAVTGFGAVIGTLEYMSPEQAELNQLDVDSRSDIYALGVLLYELLTGSTPLEREQIRHAANLEILRLIREEPPPPPSTRISTTEELPSIAASRGLEPKQLSGAVRGELDWIVMRCLEKDRTRRYQSADGLARDLERYLTDEPVEACPPSAFYRLVKFARRHRTGFTAAAVALGLLLAGSVIATWLALRAMRAETVAREQADVAHAIIGFVQDDLLTGASPLGSPDRDLKLRTVLDRAAQRARGRFHDKPLVEAGLDRTMGVAYLSLGDYRTADTLLSRAVEGYTGAGASRRREQLVARRDLAVVRFREGRLDEARKAQEVLLPAMRTEFGPEHVETFKCVGALTNVLVAQARMDEARRLVEGVLPALQRTLGADHEMTLTAMLRLAQVDRAQGRLAEGRALNEQVLAVSRSRLGSDHAITVLAMNNLGAVLLLLGHVDEARRLYQETLEIKRRTLGSEHPSTLVALYNLADLDLHARRFAEAQAGFAEALAVQRRVLGDEHTDTMRSMLGLGRVYLARGVLDSARSVLEQVLAAQRQALGPDHPDALITANVLADVDLKAHRDAEARAGYLRVIEARRRVLGPRHPDTLQLSSAVAWLLVANPDSAFRDPARAAELARAVLAQTPDSGRVWNTLGVAECRSGHWHDAIAAFDRSIALRHGGDAYDYFFLAISEWRLGRKDESRTWYRKGVADMTATHNEDLALARFRAEAERALGPAAR